MSCNDGYDAAKNLQRQGSLGNLSESLILAIKALGTKFKEAKRYLLIISVI